MTTGDVTAEESSSLMIGMEQYGAGRDKRAYERILWFVVAGSLGVGLSSSRSLHRRSDTTGSLGFEQSCTVWLR